MYALDSKTTVFAISEMTWDDSAPGYHSIVLRDDPDDEEWFGLVAWQPGVQTGLHQHQGLSTGYILSGTIEDDGGRGTPGTLGVNFAGDTHNAVAYPGCMMVSRLDYPLIYAPDAELSKMHGRDGDAIQDIFPLKPRERIVPGGKEIREAYLRGDFQRPFDFPGTNTTRITHIDYGDDPKNRRVVQFGMRTGSRLPRHITTNYIHWFVVAGEVHVNGKKIRPNSFVIFEPGAEIDATSDFGASIVVWADGPAEPNEETVGYEIYDFKPTGQ